MVAIGQENITDYEDENGNRIIGKPFTHRASRVEFNGKNCTVTIAENVQLFGVITFRGDGSSFRIGEKSSFRGHASLGHDCNITMGAGIYSGSDLQMTTAEGTDITLGDDLLIANHCRIRADDSHPIYDGISGSRINKSESVTIGNHVWLGQDVFVMPGATIGDGSVLGARSIVTKSRPIPAHSLALGSPAKVQRRKIHWVRQHLQRDLDIAESIDPLFVPDEPPMLPASNRRWSLAGMLGR